MDWRSLRALVRLGAEAPVVSTLCQCSSFWAPLRGSKTEFPATGKGDSGFAIPRAEHVEIGPLQFLIPTTESTKLLSIDYLLSRSSMRLNAPPWYSACPPMVSCPVPSLGAQRGPCNTPIYSRRSCFETAFWIFGLSASGVGAERQA